jgi:spore germination cell wall hydrolase CwlJ-like protein
VILLACAMMAAWVLLRNIEWRGRNETAGRSSQLTMDEARAFNAAAPFAAGPLKPARRYVFHGSPAGRLQATECLATAALYEAGRDERGQRAVIQVVLNRVRHRGFPKTVCGVVYQGSSRRTGCQFTFTCDGSFERRRARAGWVQARKAARRALEGYVFADVGTATHYHTDWVVPYWSGSLAKIAQVETHIFYR